MTSRSMNAIRRAAELFRSALWQCGRYFRFSCAARFRGNLLGVGTVPIPSTWGLVACSDGTQNNLTRVSKREDEAESEQQWTRIIGRMNEQVHGSSFLTKSPRTILNMASLPTRYVKSLFCWTNSS